MNIMNVDYTTKIPNNVDLAAAARHPHDHVHPVDPVLSAVRGIVERDFVDALAPEDHRKPVAGRLLAPGRVGCIDADELGQQLGRLFGHGVPKIQDRKRCIAPRDRFGAVGV